MTVDSPASPALRTDRSRALAWAVLAASILEVVAPLVTINGPGRSPASGSGPELLITPAGWAFSIWGVIYALAFAQAVAVLVAGPGQVSRRLQIDLLTLYLGGAAWIVIAGLDSSLGTAAALLVMLVASADAVVTVGRELIEPRWLRVLSRAAVGLYAGWVTAAFFLNVSTALVDTGAVAADTLPWQLLMLAAAAATLVALVVAARGILTYSVAGVWAMVGIAATGLADSSTGVVVAAAAAGVVVVGTTVAVRVSDREPAGTHIR